MAARRVWGCQQCVLGIVQQALRQGMRLLCAWAGNANVESASFSKSRGCSSSPSRTTARSAPTRGPKYMYGMDDPSDSCRDKTRKRLCGHAQETGCPGSSVRLAAAAAGEAEGLTMAGCRRAAFQRPRSPSDQRRECARASNVAWARMGGPKSSLSQLCLLLPSSRARERLPGRSASAPIEWAELQERHNPGGAP